MDRRNWEKLLSAGYEFYILDMEKRIIRKLTQGEYAHGWGIWERYKTQKETKEAFDKLINDDGKALSV